MRKYIVSLVILSLFSFFSVFAQQHSIASFSPQNASLGETVIITGTNFSSISSVTFGGVNASYFTVISPNTIKAVVANGNSGNIVVTKTGVGTPSVAKSGFVYSTIPTVTEMISDYGTFWQTNTASNNPVLPNTSHNLLSFKYNGITYSTGVNDARLSSKGMVYNAGNFKALPVVLNGTTSGSALFIAMASKIDGTTAAGLFTHENIKSVSIQSVLTDGINGLDLGTGYTNLPSGATSDYMVSAIEPSKITDNEPDILVTQVAEPTAGQATDIYRFVDANGNVVGNSFSVDLSKISSLGTWSMDLYSVSNGISFSNAKPTGTSSVNTTRQLRLVAFRLSDFGINASNYTQIRKLQIIPSGVSDVAFVAYNANAITAAPIVTINTSISSTAVCSTGGNAYIEANATVPYGETIAFQWERSTDNGTTWNAVSNNSNFSGTTTNGLSISNAVVGDKYRIRVTEVGKNIEAVSSEVTITQGTSVSLAGTLNPTSFTACVLATSGTTQLSVLPTGGTGSYSYQWKYSTSLNGTYTDIVGATSRTFIPNSSNAGVSYYKVLVKSGCYSNLSNAATVTINGNTISSVTNGVACSNGNVNLSASATGGTINWYASETTSTVAGTGSNFTTPSLSTSTNFFVGTSTSGCASPRLPVVATIASSIQLNASNFGIVSATSVCPGSISEVTITSSGIPNGTYLVNYTVSGSNNFSDQASMTFANGIGVFNTLPLTNAGSGTITINTINSLVIGGCTVSVSSGNSVSIYTYGIVPDVSNFSLSISSGCSNSSNTATINSTTLAPGTYVIEYSISGTNNVTGLSAQMPFNGTTGSFVLPSLSNYGNNNVVTINKVSQLTFPSCPTVVNYSSEPFSTNAEVSLDAGQGITTCANTGSVTLATGANAINASALFWTTSGTGTFYNNDTENALTSTVYVPSVTDIANGSVLLNLTATANTGCSDQTKSITLTILPAPNGGNVTGSAVVCSSVNATTFELTNYTGTIMKWQMSTNADFLTNVRDTSITTSTVVINNTSSSIFVRAVVGSQYCNEVYSSTGNVTVNPSSFGGFVTGNYTVCAGTNNSSFSLSGHAGSIVKWQRSTSSDFSSNVTDVNSASSTISISNVTETTYVRAVIQNGSCPIAYSNNGLISVTPAPVGGIASSSSSVCPGSSATLNLSGYVGTVARWQKCANINFTSGITNIYTASATATVTNVVAPFYYRAVITNGTCGTAYSQPVLVGIASVPSTPIVVGADTVCSGVNSTVLSTSNSFDSYQWQQSTNGITFTNIAGETNSSLTQTNLTANRYYKVVVSNGVCTATSSTTSILVYGNLGALGSITGPTNVYGIDSTVYSVPTVANVQYYVWTMPSGMTLTSSAGGNVVNVNVASYFSIGNITVKAVGYCSQTDTRSLSVRSFVPVPSVPLYGNSIVCVTNPTLQTYSVDEVPGATSYTWTLPGGATFTSAINVSRSVDVIFNSSFTSGTLSVVAKNSSGTIIAMASKSIGSFDKPDAIVGPNNLCGLTTATYSIQTPVEGVSYNWTLPTGMSIISGTGTSSIVVSISPSVPNINGYVRAQAIGACGTSAFTSLLVYKLTINGNLLGPDVVCGASINIVLPNGSITTTPSNIATYSVMSAAGAASYTWNVPSGVTITSGQGTNSINVAFSSTFGSGNITVTAANADATCTSIIKSKTVVIATANISGPTSLCGLSTATYSVPVEVANSFVWKIPTWMTVTAGSLTSNSITVSLPSVICADSVVAVNMVSDCGGNHTVTLNVGCALYTKISDAQNNTVVSAGTLINAIPVTGAIAYKFRITNGLSTFYLEKSTNSFAFSEVNSLVLGADYTVDVAVKFAGGDFGQYGCSALLKTKATKIQLSQCGAIIPSSTTMIYCDAVSGATGYKFEIKGLGLDASNPSAIGTYELTTSNRYFMLTQVPGFGYGIDYAVRVAIRNPDNSTYGQYGETCSVALKGSKVQATQCGTTVAANTMIYADALTGATYYKFEVTGLGLNTSVPTEIGTAEITTTNKYFTLSQLPGLVLGESYSIRVATKNGDIAPYGSFGESCSVSTKTTQVQASQCGLSGVLPTTVINADLLNSASTYVFEISGPGLTDAVVLTSSNRYFSFSQIPAAIYGETYSIRVAAKTTTGNVGPYGSVCTATLKTTQLQSSQCSTGSPIGFSTLIYCDAVSGATGYRFEISNLDGFVLGTLDKSTTARSFKLSEIAGLGAGVFNVRVSIKNTQGVYGPFGSTCQVMTAASIAMNSNNDDSAIDQDRNSTEETNSNVSTDEITSNPVSVATNTVTEVSSLDLKNEWNVQFDKNPFETSFKLSLQSSEDAFIQVQLIDMSGKVLESVQTSIEELNAIEFGNTVNAGAYLVKVSQGSNSKTLRLIKK